MLESCMYCKSYYSRSGNYVETRRLELPDGTWCHYGCLRHWLVDDALRRHFPGINGRERDVIRRRLGLGTPGKQFLKPLYDIGEEMGWTGTMRASQVQNSAMKKFQQGVRRRKEKKVAREDRKILLREAVGAADAFLRSMRDFGIEPEEEAS